MRFERWNYVNEQLSRVIAKRVNFFAVDVTSVPALTRVKCELHRQVCGDGATVIR